MTPAPHEIEAGPVPPPDSEFLNLSIAALHACFRSGDVTPSQILDATLFRLDQLEPRLNAFTTILTDAARAQAARTDQVLAEGRPLAPLSGVPVSVKDLIAVGGVRAPMGSRRFSGHRPLDDATIYRRLVEAGAVVFGKANMLELAAGFVHEDFGQSNNPWDTARTAGGSSSGSAASVAAGVGFASVGSDTGGSIRLPSALCGIVGLKPTFGLVSTAGVFPLSPTLDHAGPLTRSVAEARSVLEVIAGPARTSGRSAAPTAADLHVGVVDGLVGDLQPEVARRFAAALDALRVCGATIVDTAVPGSGTVAEQTISILLAEAADQHRDGYPQHAEDYSPGMRGNLDAGHGLSALDYLQAQQLRRSFTQQVDEALTRVDVLACPTVGFTAPSREPDFAEALPYVRRTMPFNVSGHPALTVPAPAAAGSLPVGLQLVAARGGEDLLLTLGESYERELGGFPGPWST